MSDYRRFRGTTTNSAINQSILSPFESLLFLSSLTSRFRVYLVYVNYAHADEIMFSCNSRCLCSFVFVRPLLHVCVVAVAVVVVVVVVAVVVFAHLIYCLCNTSHSTDVNSDPGLLSRLFSPLPTTVRAFIYIARRTFFAVVRVAVVYIYRLPPSPPPALSISHATLLIAQCFFNFFSTQFIILALLSRSLPVALRSWVT